VYFKADNNFSNEKGNEIEMVGDSVAWLFVLVHIVQQTDVINTPILFLMTINYVFQDVVNKKQ